MNYVQRRAELIAKHAVELSELNARRDILEALPADLQPFDWFVHIHRLYDCTATLKLAWQHYESIRRGPVQTLDTIKAFALACPAVPVTLYRDGPVGIRTAADAQAAYETASARGSAPALRPIAPAWIRVQPASFSNTLAFAWIAEIAGRLVSCEIEFPLWGDVARKLASVDLRYSSEREGRRVVVNRMSPTDAVRIIGSAKAYVITYASGSHKHPGDHLLFWDSANGEHADVSMADIMARLEGSAQ